MEVKCTQCGGSVPVRERQGLATCPFCSSSLYVDLLEGVGHFLIKPVLEEKHLPSQLTTYLERRERRGQLSVNRASLVYWPFWQVQDEEEKVSINMAASHPITAIEQSRVSSGSMAPFKEEELEEAWVEPPQDTLDEFLERMGIEARKAWLIHVPFWQVRYSYDNMEYEAWVDAVRGEVFADELPPTFAKEKDKLYQKVIALIFLVYFVLGVSFSNGDMAAVIMVLASLPLYFLVNWLVREEAS